MLSLESSCCARSRRRLLLIASMTGLQATNHATTKSKLVMLERSALRKLTCQIKAEIHQFLRISMYFSWTNWTPWKGHRTMRCLEIRRSKPLRRRRRGSARHAVCGTSSTGHIAASTDHIAASPHRPHATRSSEH